MRSGWYVINLAISDMACPLQLNLDVHSPLDTQTAALHRCDTRTHNCAAPCSPDTRTRHSPPAHSRTGIGDAIRPAPPAAATTDAAVGATVATTPQRSTNWSAGTADGCDGRPCGRCSASHAHAPGRTDADRRPARGRAARARAGIRGRTPAAFWVRQIYMYSQLSGKEVGGVTTIQSALLYIQIFLKSNLLYIRNIHILSIWGIPYQTKIRSGKLIGNTIIFLFFFRFLQRAIKTITTFFCAI